MNTTTDLQVEYNSLKEHIKSLQSELETKSNLLHEQKNALSVATEREKHYLHEIEVLQLNQSNENPEVLKLQTKIEQLQEEYSDMKQHLDSEILKCDVEYDKLNVELKTFTREANHNTFRVSDNERFHEEVMLEAHVEALRDEIQEKQLFMDDIKVQNKKLFETINELRLELQQINENVECKKQDLIETYDLMNTLQEDLVLTRNELQLLKLKSTQNSTENSLFAEVNDRRLELQDTVIKLKQKCNKMKEEASTKQRQISMLRLHNEELLHIFKNDPLECTQDYETLITTYRDHIDILKKSSEDYQKLLSEKQNFIEQGLPNNIVEFTNNLMQEKQKHEEQLEDAIGMEFRAKKMMSLQHKELTLKVQELQTKILELEDKFKNLELQKHEAAVNEKRTPTLVEVNLTNFNENKKESEHEAPDIKRTILKASNEKESEDNKENSLVKATKHKVGSEKEEKKVTFATNAIDSEPTSKHPLRKGGRILQVKTIFIPKVVKK